MISNITIGMSNQSPLILTTSVVSYANTNSSILQKLQAVSGELSQYVLRITKHNYVADNDNNINNLFFAYEATEKDTQGERINLRPFTELFKGNADETTFENAIISLIEALYAVEKSGIDTDLVYIMPREIFLTAENKVKLIVLPMNNASKTDFAGFINELFELLPFAISTTKLNKISEYFRANPSMYSFKDLYLQLSEISPPQSALQSVISSTNNANIADTADRKFQIPEQAPTSLPVETPTFSNSEPVITNFADSPVALSAGNALSAAQSAINAISGGTLTDIPRISDPTPSESANSEANSPLIDQKMPPTLTNQDSGEIIRLTTFPFTIGRSVDFTSYTIVNPKISSVHCRILQTPNGEYQITDTNSTNHVRINEEKITPNTPTPLHNGDLIRLADVVLKFSV